VAAQTWSHTKESRRLVLAVKAFDEVGKVKIGQIVAVIGQKNFVFAQVFLDSFQSLADIRFGACVNKSDCPVVNIRVEHLQLFSAIRKHEIIGKKLRVIDEVILDGLRAIAQAKDEIFVAEVSVIFHYVPQDWPIPYVNHRFRDALTGLSNSHSESAAEQDYFHVLTAFLPNFSP
jgi:hypothetical protein